MTATTATIPTTPPRRRLRPVLLVCLLCAAGAAGGLLFGTEVGRQLRDLEQLKAVGADVRRWVAAHPFHAPFIFLSLYVACSLLALPVWWLQILSGYGFGLAAGIGWSLAGHTFGSLTTVYFARWLGAEWIRAKAGRKLKRFNRLSDALGHNGLLVVLGARICYVVPYNLSNYLFGLTGVRGRDVALGTMLGSIPVVAGWVAMGARPSLLIDGRFWGLLLASNLLLISSLVVYSLLRKRRTATIDRDIDPVDSLGAPPGRAARARSG